MLLEEIEKRVESNVEDWDIDILKKITEDEEILESIGEISNLKEFYLSVKKRNEKFADDFLAPSYYGLSLDECEGRLGKLIKEHTEDEITVEQLKKKAKEIMEDENVFNRMAAVLTYLNYTESKDEAEKLKPFILENFKTTFEMLRTQDLDQYYILIAEWLDVIYPLEEVYFEITKEKIFEDFREELNDFQDNVNGFLEKISREIAANLENNINSGE